MQPLARTAALGGAARAATEEFVFTRTAAKRTELRRLRQLVRAATLRIVSGLRQVLCIICWSHMLCTACCMACTC